MSRFDGTVPHYIQIQMGAQPDPIRDANAVPYVPLDELPETVGKRLSELARSLVAANSLIFGPSGNARVVNVDGKPCDIPVSSRPDLEREVARLVDFWGWRSL